jgi:tryptophanyl-tRNA synthetase
MRVVTDSKTVEEPKDPENDTLFSLYSLFADPGEIRELDRMYRAGGLAYGTVKDMVFEKINEHFRPFREKRQELSRDRDRVEKILAEGAEKARYIALKTLRKVRRKTGLAYRKS